MSAISIGSAAVYIGEEAFKACLNLTEVGFSNDVFIDKNAFANCRLNERSTRVVETRSDKGDSAEVASLLAWLKKFDGE